MTFDDDEGFTSEWHERRIVRCRGAGCNAKIIFLRTRAGKLIPINADSVEPDDDEYEHGRHEPHHASCPAAAQFRKGRGQ